MCRNPVSGTLLVEMGSIYDAIVVGARCSGASTAVLLARAGWKVLLLDRAQSLDKILDTHFIQPSGVALLAGWGLLEPLRQTGSPAITTQSIDVGDMRVHGAIPAAAYAPRRRVLDQLLADAAVAAGADLRLGCTAVGLPERDGRVAGVTYRTASQRTERARARLVVGADGMRSSVARLVGAGTYRTRPRLTCAYLQHWSGVPARGAEIMLRHDRFFIALPTHNELTLVAGYFPQREFDQIRRDALNFYLTAVRETSAEFFSRLHAGQPEERMYGTGSQHNFLRPAVGPGWALVGDAGHHRDSVSPWGVTHAFHQADELARVLVQADPDDPIAVDRALKTFATLREDSVDARYDLDLASARLDPAPVRSILRVIQDDQFLVDQYLRVMFDMLSWPDFVALPEVARRMGNRTA